MMEKISQLLQARYEEVARTISEEMGSPISFSIMGQVFASTMVLDYYTGLAREYQFEDFRQGALGPVLVRTRAGRRRRLHRAVERPAVHDHAEDGAGAGVRLHRRAEARAGDAARRVPPRRRDRGGRAARGRGQHRGRRAASVGEHLVTHRDVDKISFTGSTAAGKRIGALCGAQLKRCTLELGGKSAAIILDDADLATAIPGLLPNSIMNNGQACVAQTRILASRAALRRRRRRARGGDVGGQGRRSARPRDRRRPAGRVSASATGSRATSPRAGRKARASSSAAAVPPSSTRAGSSSRPCSPTSTTR